MKDFLKRLPIVRHVRWLYLSWQVERHYEAWRSLGMLPSNRHHDDAILDKIWKGER